MDGLMAANPDPNSMLLTKGPKQRECHMCEVMHAIYATA